SAEYADGGIEGLMTVVRERMEAMLRQTGGSAAAPPGERRGRGMRPATVERMRAFPALLLMPILTACGDSSLTVRGTLLPGSPDTDVYVVGQPLRALVEADSFVIEGVRGETVELEFAEESDRLGRMRIEDWTR